MGKFIAMMSILIFVSLFFVVTNQIAFDSPTSIIIKAIESPETIKESQFWLVMIGLVGIGAFAATSGIITGTIVNATNVLKFASMSVVLAGLVGDYISIFLYLRNLNSILATAVMGTAIILFTLVLVEWLRGKD